MHQTLIFLLIQAILFLAQSQSTNVKKGSLDYRNYQSLKLPNQLDCLFVEDRRYSRVSVAMSVAAGSFLDPKQYEGRASFVAYTLFKTKPQHFNQTFEQFMNKSRMFDVIIKDDVVIFWFEVYKQNLDQAINRFSQIFNMDSSKINKDIYSIDFLPKFYRNMFKKQNTDSSKLMYLGKSLSKPDHPFRKYIKLINQNIISEKFLKSFKQFYNAYYAPHLMKLVIYGNIPVSELKKKATKYFSDINKNSQKTSKFQLQNAPYADSVFGNLYKMNGEISTLTLQWIISNQSAYSDFQPDIYMYYLMNDKSRTSLLTYLTDNDLVLSSKFQSKNYFNAFDSCILQYALTEKGVANVNQVIGHTLFFINRIANSKLEKWVFDELKQVLQRKFNAKYDEQMTGINFVVDKAQKMQYKKVDQILQYKYYLKEWKPDLTTSYINQMNNRSNMFAILQAKNIEITCKNKQSGLGGINYCSQSINDIKIEQFQYPFNFMLKNPYMPKDLSIRPLAKVKQVNVITDTTILKLFLKRDHSFEIPRVIVKLNFYFSYGDVSTKFYLIRNFYKLLMQYNLRSLLYQALMAQAKISFNFVNYFTFGVQLQGFRDSISKVLPDFLKQFFAFNDTFISNNKDDNLYFNSRKKQAEQKSKKSKLFAQMEAEQLYEQSLVNYTDPIGQKIASQVKNIKLDDIVSFSKQWRKKLFVEGLISGNLNQQESQAFKNNISQLIQGVPLPKNQIGLISQVKLTGQKIWIIDRVISSENSSLLIYYQFEQFSIANKLYLDLTIQLINSLMSGYVRFGVQNIRGILAAAVFKPLVNLTYQSAIEIMNRIDLVRNQGLAKNNIQDEFKKIKSKLQANYQSQDESMKKQADRIWMEISTHKQKFFISQEISQLLQKISLTDLKRFIDNLFGSNRKLFQIHMISSKSVAQNNKFRDKFKQNNPNVQFFADADQFKKNFSFYADFFKPV